MLNINAINSLESYPPRSPSYTHRSTFADQFSIVKADTLLQTTRQHGNWQKIQREDPSKAVKIARLLLERHAFIDGTTPRDASGRQHFDNLTDQLRTEGIHLYKSHEFNEPIFTELKALPIPQGPISDVVMKRSARPVDTTMKNLRSRFENKDCLEFLAGILEEKGIAYYGKEGMANALVTKAKNEGKNTNTYLTGEGITHTLCREPVTIHVKNNSSDSIEDVWDKIRPHMKKGSILSFSSRSFGHTGIIDKVANRLTFLNSSGSIGKPGTYKVLAEEPKNEIRTWLQRARRQKTFLDITVGDIDPNLAGQFDNIRLATQGAQVSDDDLLTSRTLAQGLDLNG